MGVWKRLGRFMKEGSFKKISRHIKLVIDFFAMNPLLENLLQIFRDEDKSLSRSRNMGVTIRPLLYRFPTF